jgi:hypothetical protein
MNKRVNKRAVIIALGALSLPVLGGATFALAQSVDDKPAPQVVTPRAKTSAAAADDHGGERPEGVSDDVPSPTPTAPSAPSPDVQLTPPTLSDDGPFHDLGDDHGGDRPEGVSDDGPLHDVGDDHGGDRPEGVSDDGPLHDVGDDHGGGSDG